MDEIVRSEASENWDCVKNYFFLQLLQVGFWRREQPGLD